MFVVDVCCLNLICICWTHCEGEISRAWTHCEGETSRAWTHCEGETAERERSEVARAANKIKHEAKLANKQAAAARKLEMNTAVGVTIDITNSISYIKSVVIKVEDQVVKPKVTVAEKYAGILSSTTLFSRNKGDCVLEFLNLSLRYLYAIFWSA